MYRKHKISVCGCDCECVRSMSDIFGRFIILISLNLTILLPSKPSVGMLYG